MTDPISYFNLPPLLASSYPQELLPVASALLAPLSEKELQDLKPTVEHMVAVIESQLAETLGMGYNSMTEVMADIFARLIFDSRLITVETCDANQENECDGKHAVRITQKGIDFVRDYKSWRDRKNPLEDKLRGNGDDFLKGWSETE